MCKVYNKKYMKETPPNSVYIGRGSVWGNRFTHLNLNNPNLVKVETRDIAVARYREWLLNNPTLLTRLPELKGKNLICFCAPQKCHGDVLLELANAKNIDKEEE